MNARQYIFSKQSTYSGKGYWLAMYSTSASDASEYKIEAGVYVGSQAWRIHEKTTSIKLDARGLSWA